MNVEEFLEAAKAAIEDAVEYQEKVASKRVIADVQPGYLSSLMPASAPVDPEPFSAIRADFHDKIMPGMTHWHSPRFMAFFSCHGEYPTIIAEIYSNFLNGAYFNWISSPAATELEVIVLDWLAQELNLPECFKSKGSTRGGGVLHGSASEAVLTVMAAARDKYVAARTKHMPDGVDKEDEIWRVRSKMVVLGSTGTHSSTQKAANILGLRFEAIRAYEEDSFSLQGRHLATKLEQLEARGLEPFFLTATMGTTDFCVIDDFGGIADVLKQRLARGRYPDIWVHVDAALAGSALMLPEYKHNTKAFHNFSSFNFNPQKWLLTGYDCSATFVRSREDLINTLSIKPAYLRNRPSADDTTEYRDWQIALGKRFRSLKLWFVLRSYGISGLQAHVRNGISMAESLERKLRTRPDLFTVFTPASFALVTLRVVGRDMDDMNARTQRVYDRILDEGEYYLTGTVVEGKSVIRVTLGVKSVREEHVEGVFGILVREAEKECREKIDPSSYIAKVPEREGRL
ncbi:hypothetical protein E4U30_004979 [Claviceps sp. LM220 group G6]|nr:hypothetical protein E4U30_004979 [Claviceps sp. LM220 group G6]KAG6103643.1 hypothetical protein E4U31_002654 [Claviceps sp. LM219 group G6]